MKKLSFLLLFFFFTTSYAQDYQEMVAEGATWMYAKKDGGPVSYFAYHIKGDTTINGVDYKILNDQGVDLGADDILSLNSNSTPLAYLREEIDAKKVYAIIDDATEFSLCFGVTESSFMDSHVLGENEGEYVLYDFSLEEGDYIESQIPADISSIESTEVFGYEVDHIMLSGGNPYYEKFGYNEGLFFPHFIFFVGGGFVNLLQYCITDIYECEVLIGPLSSKGLKQGSFTISPNPVQSHLNIEVPNEVIQSLSIFSTDGRLLLRREDINSTTYELDLSTISFKGILIVQGETENSSFVDRVLKH